MTQLEWVLRSPNDHYYGLNTVDLAHPHFNNMAGVYVIWYIESSYVVTVYAGQGTIKDRFYAHRNDYRIQQCASKTLYATWARASISDRDGIEAYLHDRLDPLVGNSPDAPFIPVNLPWA